MKTQTCGSCQHFKGGRIFVESQFPGLLSLGSALGSPTLGTGLCEKKNTCISSRSGICSFYLDLIVKRDV